MSGGRPEAFKNDFPNALKRNLHNWAQWRVDVNDQLVTSLMTGQRNVEVEPLGKYLHNSQHPTENPSTLLAYSASTDNISSLGMRRFLHYGIPRAKVNHTRARQSEHSNSQASSTTYTIHEDPAERSRDGNINYHDPPYHAPEPAPDYSGNLSDNDADDITAPGSSCSSSTNSSDTETLYNARSPPSSYRSGGAEVTQPPSSKRPLSRTYSTLNALDPIYMTQKSRNTLHNKLASKKQAPVPPKNSRPLSSLYSPPAHLPTASLPQSGLEIPPSSGLQIPPNGGPMYAPNTGSRLDYYASRQSNYDPHRYYGQSPPTMLRPYDSGAYKPMYY